MNDYNNGQIWGWNGGECPVHPKTKVRIWSLSGGKPVEMQARQLMWDYGEISDDIIAFQVITPYVEPTPPKTIWVNEYEGRWYYYTDEQVAKRSAGHNATRIAVKYVEARDE